MSTKIYTVTAYRYGNKESHSYVVLSTLSLSRAMFAADNEENYRGGKYDCEIIETLDKESSCGDDLTSWSGCHRIVRALKPFHLTFD